MGEVEVHVPGEVGCPDGGGVQGDFNTRVAHRTHIDGIVARDDAGRERCGLVVKQVAGVAGEELDGTREAVLPQAEVYADVEVAVLLPGQFLVALLCEHGAVLAGLRVVCGRVHVGVWIVQAVDVVCLVFDERVVALFAVADLQLQHVEPVVRTLHERLFREHPAQAGAVEVTPAVALGKA